MAACGQEKASVSSQAVVRIGFSGGHETRVITTRLQGYREPKKHKRLLLLLPVCLP